MGSLHHDLDLGDRSQVGARRLAVPGHRSPADLVAQVSYRVRGQEVPDVGKGGPAVILALGGIRFPDEAEVVGTPGDGEH